MEDIDNAPLPFSSRMRYVDNITSLLYIYIKGNFDRYVYILSLSSRVVVYVPYIIYVALSVIGHICTFSLCFKAVVTNTHISCSNAHIVYITYTLFLKVIGHISTFSLCFEAVVTNTYVQYI